MVRFAHISDTHLGFRQYNLDEREEDFYESFREAIDAIIEERVDFVIHSGDLFEHNRPKVKALMEAQKAFLKLHEKNIPVYAIAGNHDIVLRRGTIPPQALFQHFGLKLLGHKNKYVVLKEHNLFIGGLPYYPRYYSEALKKQLEELSKIANNYKKRILILHQGLDTHLPYEQAFELRLTELPTNFQYYAMGHVHRRIKEKYGEGYLSYPGSIDIWRLDEVEDFKAKGKGFNLVDLEGDKPEIHHITLKNTRHFDSYLIKTENFEKELEEIKNKVKKLAEISPKPPIVGIKVKGKMKFDSVYYGKQIKDAIGNFVFKFRLSFEPVLEGIDIERQATLNLIDILNEIFHHKRDLVDFTKTIFEYLKDNEIDDAVKFAEEFYRERWQYDS